MLVTLSYSALTEIIYMFIISGSDDLVCVGFHRGLHEISYVGYEKKVEEVEIGYGLLYRVCA